MSIWQALRREAAGAWRSLRYDLRRGRSSTGTDGTIEEEAGTARGRIVFSAAALMLLAVGIGGAWALVGGVRALLDPGAPPAGLPAHAGPAPSGSVQPVGVTPTSAVPTLGIVPTSSPTRRAPGSSPSARTSPPVPTPAPTCSCTKPPAPSPTPTQAPSPTPSPTPTEAPSPTPPTTPDPTGGVSTSTHAPA